MKQAVGAFLLFIFVVILSVVFLEKSLEKQASAQEPVNTCFGNKSCSQDPLSVYVKTTPTPTLSGSEQPSGYCLMVPVLLYHHIEPQADAIAKGQTSLNVDNGIFDQQMGYLASNGYTTITAQTLVNAILAHGTLPPKSVVVTMDDGYLDIYDYAYPILQKYHLIGNLMVPSGLLGVNSGTNSYYSWGQLKEMVGSGVMSVYNHTWSHYPMAQGPVSKDVAEITTSQQQFAQNLGSTSNVFVYPYGSGQTLGWVWQLLKQNGFVAAFSTLPGVWQCEGNIMDLPRIHIGNAPLSSYGI